MELWLPDQIALDETSNALTRDVEEAARRVDDHRPLPPEVVARIDDELEGERVYSSNAIEGNTLDLRETVMVLKHGSAGTKKKREAKEAINLGQAIKQVTAWLDARESIHATDRILRVHETLLGGIHDEWAGKFREKRVMISGAKYQPPDHTIIEALMERVMAYLSAPRDSNIVLRSTWAHWAIARIHPFYDGNGRIARLWQDAVLLQGHLTCAIVRPEDRTNYLAALMSADEGEFNPLIQFIAQRIAATLDRYLEELGKTSDFVEWVKEVAGEVDERAAERSKLSYQRWRRKMESLRREFQLCAAKVSEASKAVAIQVQPYPLIDQTQWENIRSGIGATLTWHFKLDFSTPGKRVRYYFYFAQHFWSEGDDERYRSERRVSLLISEDDGSGTGIRLDLIPDCPLSIREIDLVDDAFVIRRADSVRERNVPALRIAQEFIRDVVLHRLT